MSSGVLRRGRRRPWGIAGYLVSRVCLCRSSGLFTFDAGILKELRKWLHTTSILWGHLLHYVEATAKCGTIKFTQHAYRCNSETRKIHRNIFSSAIICMLRMIWSFCLGLWREKYSLEVQRIRRRPPSDNGGDTSWSSRYKSGQEAHSQ